MNPNQSRVITRFAPSPTGNLHIGGARTALFNFLYARANNGCFLLRIDDTDMARSSSSYTDNIVNSLRWLGLNWDNESQEVYQSRRSALYHEVVDRLVASGAAYRCYASEEDEMKIKEMATLNERKVAMRNCPISDRYTLRFKMDLDGEIVVHDTIAGEIAIKYENLDDFVLIRQDGSPTYMLASVVDDGEMGITNIIRGSEHLPNTYRQLPLIKALGYHIPTYSHIPLIHDAEGRKLSKRYAAASVHEYEQMGILPEALCNYMLRLGWGHGDKDVVPLQEAKQIFNLDGLRPSPAKFDMDKLLSLNSHYIKQLPDDELISRLNIPKHIIPQVAICLTSMREKGNTLTYISEMSTKLFSNHIPEYFDQIPELHQDELDFLRNPNELLDRIDFDSPSTIKESLMNAIDSKSLDRKNILMFLRVALTGMRVSPGLFEIIKALDKDLCAERLRAALSA